MELPDMRELSLHFLENSDAHPGLPAGSRHSTDSSWLPQWQ